MPYTINYSPEDQLIKVDIFDKTGPGELKEVVENIMKTVQSSACVYILTDLSSAEMNLSMSDLYALPQIISQVMCASGQFQVRDFTRAFVVAPHMIQFLFYETVSHNRGHNTELFFTLREAANWLKACQESRKLRDDRSLPSIRAYPR